MHTVPATFRQRLGYEPQRTCLTRIRLCSARFCPLPLLGSCIEGDPEPNLLLVSMIHLFKLEEGIEKVKAIYRCRFMAILGVFGSLMGSFLCFIKAFAEASSNSTGVTSFLENVSYPEFSAFMHGIVDVIIPKNGESKNVDLKKKDFQLQKINCKYECSRRCSKASKRKRCKRACKSCCHRCHCVPPGTYGNKDLCPCYSWK
ncbi:hypothetical protein V8G54_034237 [Vigna mungo]|uniref:Uncharacterized protein n=1 Tax=Vigna mungo TaxID=3915 RepID=A0AAQ3MQT6_VIGMU